METLEKLVPVLAYIFGKEGVEDWKKKLLCIVVCEVIFLVAALADVFTGGAVHTYGLHPREFPSGLFGIAISPFIHPDFTQFLVNAIPFAVLSGFVLMREDGVTTWAVLSFMQVAFGGVIVWLIGRSEADHNGASGLILCYFAFLVVYGIIRREMRATIISGVTLIVYGGLVWSTLPNHDTKISWESHLLAIAVGALVATWELEVASLKANGVGKGGNGGAGASAGAKGESGANSEKAPLTSDDLQHDDDLHDAEVGAGGVSGAKSSH